jgi:Secretion system C-terminal sorting domain
MKRVLLALSSLWTIVSSSQTVYWDFSTAVPLTNSASGLSISEITEGNNHGTTDLLSGSLPSSGYSNASGGNNAEAAVWTGNLVIGSPGSTYFEFTLTPQAGNIFKLEAISFGSRSTATGPTSYSLRTSLDAYTADIATGSFLNNSSWALLSNSSLSVISSVGSAITFRLYGYNGSGSTISNVPNWRIDDLSLTVTVTASGALPVQFGTVKAFQTSSGVHLQWSNLTETAIAQYSLERSSDGKEFNAINLLEALKNDGGKADYQCTDFAPIKGDNFYRVKAVEKTGSISYSDIIRINVSSNNTSLVLYPNPVQGNHIKLQIGHLPSGTYSIRIYNSTAQLMYSQMINHAGGSLSETVLFNNFKRGSYLLEITGNTILKKQFIVQ